MPRLSVRSCKMTFWIWVIVRSQFIVFLKAFFVTSYPITRRTLNFAVLHEQQHCHKIYAHKTSKLRETGFCSISLIKLLQKLIKSFAVHDNYAVTLRDNSHLPHPETNLTQVDFDQSDYVVLIRSSNREAQQSNAKYEFCKASVAFHVITVSVDGPW